MGACSDHEAAVRHLCETDPHLAAVVEEFGVPPVFRRPPTFATLVLIILEQQVSLGSAAAAFRRLGETIPIEPEATLALSDSTLREIGFSHQKARYVRALAAAVVSGQLELAKIVELPDDAARESLVTIPGIGRWSADVFLLSALGRPDIWPVGDRALQVGTAEVLGLASIPASEELEALGEQWRPRRSTAARIVWHHYLATRGRLT